MYSNRPEFDEDLEPLNMTPAPDWRAIADRLAAALRDTGVEVKSDPKSWRAGMVLAEYDRAKG